MDTKRVIIAVALSAIVLLAWSWFFKPTQPVKPTAQDAVTTEKETPPASAAPSGESKTPELPKAQEAAIVQGKTILVETPEYSASFNTQGGILSGFELNEYRESIEEDAPPVNLVEKEAVSKAPMGLLWDTTQTWRRGTWSSSSTDVHVGEGEQKTITFTGNVGDLKIVRTFTFTAGSYFIDENVVLENTGSGQLQGQLGFTMASEALSEKENRYNRTKVVYLTDSGFKQEDDIKDDLQKGIAPESAIKWAGVASNYFLMAVVPSSEGTKMKGKYEDEVFRVAIGQGVGIGGGQQEKLSTIYYLGPKNQKNLFDGPKDLGEAVHYGWFDIISKPLIRVLNYFYSFVGNYGVAIIILTIIIKIIFWPLSHKSYKSMEQMKKLQPMMAKIREKYKDDRQKMNQELMQLYKTYKVNPAGGCLPMLLQIPVFLALYQGLLGAVELRHASFIAHVPFTDIVWLADLSAKDPYYVTPIIMGATMFLQQKLTPSPGDPTQKKIMMFLPLVFMFVFLTFPAGLVVYWLVNNVLSIAQQWLLTRKA